ncbi:MAG: DivIVA domain-containing protein [Erysipelotrichaceae bacterium]|nr:DivIVA domain-containing protein [Erysipelotrichaceae bacterium]
MKRFSVVNNGYNIEEVNNFIDIVIKKLEKLSEENNNYLMQLENLKKQANQNTDIKVAKALIAAQETTDKMKELAKAEAELIVKEAKDNASAIVQEALVNAQKTEQEYQLLKKKYNVYKAKMESLVKSQLELLKEETEDE